MSKELIDKFNEITNGKFAYLKLSAVNVDLPSQTIEPVLLYPEAFAEEVRRDREEISTAFKRILQTNASLSVKLQQSHFDAEFFRRKLFEFMRKYPSLSVILNDDNVLISNSSDIIKVTIEVTPTLYDYCSSKKINLDLEHFIDLNYCEKIKIEFSPTIAEDDSVDFKEEDNAPSLEMDDPEGRFIRVQNVDNFIGTIVYDRAQYIVDANRPKEYAVMCGKIENFQEMMRKPREGVPSDKKFFKFMLKDFTATMPCLYFPSKRTVNLAELLRDGKEIIARGKLVLDEFKGNGALSFMIKDISTCTLPEDFTEVKLRRKVDDEYRFVFPQPYIVTRQNSLFDVEVKPPQYSLNKSFCVFDIETTGLNPDLNKIIEIGAVKIVDGKMTETFSTFIDPKEPIPPRISELTGIVDDDVVGKPLIEDVLPDFYKFSYNDIMVGQNVQFDYSFIALKGAKMNIYFENEKMDTLSLARKYIPGLKNFKLGTLTSYFGITNQGAHRAIYDAIATAELFLKLLDFM